MGGAKRMMEEIHGRQAVALGLCLEADAVEECENHPGCYYEGSEGVEAAHELAEARFAEDGVSGFDDLETLIEAVQSAYDENSASDGCAICQRNADRD